MRAVVLTSLAQWKQAVLKKDLKSKNTLNARKINARNCHILQLTMSLSHHQENKTEKNIAKIRVWHYLSDERMSMNQKNKKNSLQKMPNSMVNDLRVHTDCPFPACKTIFPAKQSHCKKSVFPVVKDSSRSPYCNAGLYPKHT